LIENSLLSHVFGKKLNEKIENLINYGYINKMEKGGFPGCPFKIPLFGKWIQKEHPFIRTIIQSIDIIADKIDLEILVKEIEKTPRNKLTPFNKEKILDIARQWCALWTSIVKERSIAGKDRLKKFFESLCRYLNLDIKEKGTPNECYFILDIKNLKIGILEEAMCFIQDRPELLKDDITNIETRAGEFAQKAESKLTLFFYFRRVDEVESLVKKPYLSLITIDENELKRIILSDRPVEVFKRIILSKLSLQKVSPYKTAGPEKAIFYGRSDTINRMSRPAPASYAIVGARKIGKTSLLHRIKDNPPPGTTYIYMELDYEFSGARSYRTFFKSLQVELERQFHRKVSFSKFPLGVDMSRLPEVVHELIQDGRKVIFIFDEIDGLIEFDKKHNYKLSKIFRSMSQKNDCQFIFSGFKDLYRRKREIDNPLYNFCEEIILEPLDEEAALALITKPMESIGINYKNNDHRELILSYTACHPNLLQFFCKHLIEKIEKHQRVEDRRTIFVEDIDELYNKEYEDYIMDQVYMFFSLNPINQLILVVLAQHHSNGKTFPLDEIRDKLADEGEEISRNELYQHLKDLEMRFILLDEGKSHYKFALPVFPDILKKRIDEFFKNKIILELKANASKPF
jgi:hypothetical protein